MKTQIRYVILAAALACVPLLHTGCAVTRGQQSAGTYIDDKTITAKVKTALLRDSTVKGTDVDVTTFNGAVQLSGFVESQEQKDRAGELARQVSGVQQVHNSLIVQTGRPGTSTSKSSDKTHTDVEIKTDTDDKSIDVDVDRNPK
jgi:hyperosmotically inducible protein